MNSETVPQPQFSDERRALLRARLAERAAGSRPTVSVLPRSADTVLPLTYEQEELWFLQEFAPESTMYNIPVVWHIHGHLAPDRVSAALGRLVARHELLRTRFEERDGRPVQIVDPPTPRRLRVRRLHGLDELSARVRLACARPFDLTSSHQLRTLLLQASPTEHTLVLDMHHIVSDEWSAGLLWRDFSQLYAEACGVRAEPLPRLPVQYGDYALWQRRQLSGTRLTQLNTYWRNRLAGLTDSRLPTDRPHPREQTFAGGVHWVPVPPSSAAALARVARDARATPFMAYLAVFAVLLAETTGHGDVAVGTPTSGRSRPELRDLVGFFVNTLVIRADLRGRPGFRELLDQVRRTTLEAYAHESLPFRKVVEAVQPKRHPGRSPLIQVMYTYAPPERPEPWTLPGATVSPDGVDMAVARFELVLNVRDDPHEPMAAFEYNTALFGPQTVARMARRFCELVDQIAADPDRVPVAADA